MLVERDLREIARDLRQAPCRGLLGVPGGGRRPTGRIRRELLGGGQVLLADGRRQRLAPREHRCPHRVQVMGQLVHLAGHLGPRIAQRDDGGVGVRDPLVRLGCRPRHHVLRERPRRGDDLTGVVPGEADTAVGLRARLRLGLRDRAVRLGTARPDGQREVLLDSRALGRGRAGQRVDLAPGALLQRLGVRARPGEQPVRLGPRPLKLLVGPGLRRSDHLIPLGLRPRHLVGDLLGQGAARRLLLHVEHGPLLVPLLPFGVDLRADPAGLPLRLRPDLGRLRFRLTQPAAQQVGQALLAQRSRRVAVQLLAETVRLALRIAQLRGQFGDRLGGGVLIGRRDAQVVLELLDIRGDLLRRETAPHHVERGRGAQPIGRRHSVMVPLAAADPGAASPTPAPDAGCTSSSSTPPASLGCTKLISDPAVPRRGSS